jgi:hypothetical protein
MSANAQRRVSMNSAGSLLASLVLLCVLPSSAQASLFQGEQLDSVADAISWVVLFIAPVVAIAVFWLVHILPEKIAEKKHHPQAHAIHSLCILSLFFGGLLWPVAMLWAYTKPVFYKMGYGTDRLPPEESHGKGPPARPAPEATSDLPHLTEPVERYVNHPPLQSEPDAVRAELAAGSAAHDPRRSQRG